MRILLLAFALAIAWSTAPAHACQLKEPISPLDLLHGASSVIVADVVAYDRSGAGLVLRRVETLGGTNTEGDFTIPLTECDSLAIGQRVAIARGPKVATIVYPVVSWPVEPENQKLLKDFANATTDRGLAKVLVAHVALGWSSYVDFPMIARFLARTPSVAKALTTSEAAAMLRDLSRHPRARAEATAALQRTP